MASLVKQHSSYYTQFYDPSRIPSRKRVALKTKFKDLALRKHVELEKAYEPKRCQCLQLSAGTKRGCLVRNPLRTMQTCLTLMLGNRLGG